MRHRKASAIYGIVNQRLRLSRERLIVIALVVAASWLVWSFAQEVLVSRDMARQAAQLHQQNAALQSENRGYRRDVAASNSGAAAEEEARGDGYSKPKEKLYMIGASPAPTPAHAPPVTSAAAGTKKAGPPKPPLHAGRTAGPIRFLTWLLHLALP
jgi:cell division protein FtsB